MNEEKLRELFETIDPENKLSHEKVEEFISLMKEEKKEVTVENSNQEEILKAQLLIEDDWRKRASIAAKIISLGLDT